MGSRSFLGYGVVLAVLPYLTLKVLWLGGVMVGIPEDSPARGSGFVGPNVVTALMDVAAVGVALALTQRWGRRVPAWVLVVPAWVGMGLLVPAVVQLANGAAAAAVTGGDAVSLDGGLVEPWAYLLVYSSFFVQGLLLSAAFALYARDRWGDRLGPGGGVARQVGAPLGVAGAAVALAVAVGHLVMAFSGEGAFAGAYQEGWEYTARSGEVVNGAMAMLAAAGVLGMVRRGASTGGTVAAAWTGTGAMFGYALLTLLAVVARAPESDNVTALNGVTQLGALLAGLALALSALLHLVDRGAVSGPVDREAVSGTGQPAEPVTPGRPRR